MKTKTKHKPPKPVRMMPPATGWEVIGVVDLERDDALGLQRPRRGHAWLSGLRCLPNRPPRGRPFRGGLIIFKGFRGY
jgi:hypothetical protein